MTRDLLSDRMFYVTAKSKSLDYILSETNQLAAHSTITTGYSFYDLPKYYIELKPHYEEVTSFERFDFEPEGSIKCIKIYSFLCVLATVASQS